jgi:hypothetical protein
MTVRVLADSDFRAIENRYRTACPPESLRGLSLAPWCERMIADQGVLIAEVKRQKRARAQLQKDALGLAKAMRRKVKK